MPNTRSPGFKLLNVQMSDEFINRLSKLVTDCGYSNRSEFIRDAIVEKLHRSGFDLPADVTTVPPKTRASRSGRPRKTP
jgi:hypothetical protein